MPQERTQQFSHLANLQMLVNTPLCIATEYADTIRGCIESANYEMLLSQYSLQEAMGAFDVVSERELEATGANVMILPVHGTTAQRGDYFDIGYDELKEVITLGLREESVSGIAMDFSCIGGTVPGLNDFARWLAAAAQIKPIVGIVNEVCLSAGYWMASSLTRLYATETANVGSIGAMIKHVDISKMNEQDGIKVTYIASGRQKAMGNAHEPLSEEAFEMMQSSVMGTLNRFASHVSEQRGVDIDVIKNMEAAVADSKTGLQLGLIDEIMSFDDAIRDFTESLVRNDPASISIGDRTLNRPTGQAKTGAEGEQQANGDETPKSYEDGVAEGRQAAAAEDQKRIFAILDLPEAKALPAMARKLAQRGESVEDAKELLAMASEEANPAGGDAGGDAGAAGDDPLGDALENSKDARAAGSVPGDSENETPGGEPDRKERNVQAAKSVTELLGKAWGRK